MRHDPNIPMAIELSALPSAVSHRTTSATAAVLGVLGFCTLTILGAKIRVPVPGTPVPMTLQTAVVLLSGMVLGARLGVASQALYLLIGLVGVPVFAEPGAGPQYLFGATGGYLLSFLVVPVVVGRLARRSHGPGASVHAAVLGTVVVFAMGVGWLAVLEGDMWQALEKGLFPFWIGAILKCGLVAALGHLLWPVCRRIW